MLLVHQFCRHGLYVIYVFDLSKPTTLPPPKFSLSLALRVALTTSAGALQLTAL
jgi:hypothetical protein